jgi:Ca2+-binding EF-hand superfamily protein
MKLLLLTAVASLIVSPLDAQRRGGGTSVWDHILKTSDKDGDGKVTMAEYGRGEKPFQNLDRNKDGAITAADFQRGGRGRRQQGGRRRGSETTNDSRMQLARSLSDMFGSFLNQDGRPGIDKAEWKRIIATLKPGQDGLIPPENMTNLFGRAGQERMARMVSRMVPRTFDMDRDGTVTVSDMNALFKKLDADGDDNIEEGKEIDLPPGPGEAAPDFTLPFAKDSKKTVTLSSFRGKRPVALIFGSYT